MRKLLASKVIACPRVATEVSPREGYIWDGEMSAHHSPEVLRDDVESSGHWYGFEKTCGSRDSGVSKRLLFEQDRRRISLTCSCHTASPRRRGRIVVEWRVRKSKEGTEGVRITSGSAGWEARKSSARALLRAVMPFRVFASRKVCALRVPLLSSLPSRQYRADDTLWELERIGSRLFANFSKEAVAATKFF